MDKTVMIAECQEPWIYWWKIITQDERKALQKRHFPSVFSFVIDREIRIIWNLEGPDPIQDSEWIELANAIFQKPVGCTPKEQKEIWRQVYRIASDRI